MGRVAAGWGGKGQQGVCRDVEWCGGAGLWRLGRAGDGRGRVPLCCEMNNNTCTPTHSRPHLHPCTYALMPTTALIHCSHIQANHAGSGHEVQGTHLSCPLGMTGSYLGPYLGTTLTPQALTPFTFRPPPHTRQRHLQRAPPPLPRQPPAAVQAVPRPSSRPWSWRPSTGGRASPLRT